MNTTRIAVSMEPPRRGGSTEGMTRTLVVLLVVGLVLAPAAIAKGPHAVLTSGNEVVEPGKAWVATVELYEFQGASRPSLIATHTDGEVRAQVRAEVRKAASSMADATAFKLTTVFPHAGRWELLLMSGTRRFAFPAISVGSDEPPQDYVSFATGSEAARQGGGGVYMEPEPVEAGGRDPLPPEVFTVADAGSDSADDGGGGVGPWLLPIAGVVLAGAGIATFRRRGSR
jgi:hypothetical protein